MADYAADLNSAQAGVLRWIRDGCPDGVYEGYSHRISAAALRARGLVRISGHGSSWRAEITPDGRAYLDRKSKASTWAASIAKEPAVRTDSDESEAPPVRSREPRRLSPTELLIAELVEAGGVLRVPYWRKEGEPDYQQRVKAAQRWDKVPEGKRLITKLVEGELEIRLVDAPEGTAIASADVPVPARLSRPHAVARNYRDDAAHHRVSRATLSRCVRIVHALAAECERRGYELQKIEHTQAERAYARSVNGNADFTIVIRGHSYSVNLSEEKVPLRGVWEEQERWRKSDFYSRQAGIEPRIGRYDKEGTGRLTISVESNSREGRQHTWGDRRSWKLEEKLPELLREIEVRAAEDDHREAEQRRKAEERQAQWEAAMEQAADQFAEAHRAKVLRGQIADWLQAQHVRSYLAELERIHGNDPHTARWVEWIRDFVANLDPLQQPPRMPEAPEPKPDDLKPFLDGWSPYGSDAYS